MRDDFFFYPVINVISSPSFREPSHLCVNRQGLSSQGEQLAEFAGRLCYMSQNNPGEKTTGEYLGNIRRQGHGSVLEHANYSLLLEGVSRTLTHELVRHRAGFSYSQLSQRYVDESACQFVVPPAVLRSGGDVLARWKEEMLAARDTYQWLADKQYAAFSHIVDKVHRRKTARESARSVLPNATETKIVVTANLRAWRTMLELRCSEGAEAEIRRCMVEALRLLTIEAPSVFDDFNIYLADDSWEAASVTYHKV